MCIDEQNKSWSDIETGSEGSWCTVLGRARDDRLKESVMEALGEKATCSGAQKVMK